MYHPIGIQQLSHNQIAKLMRGQPVRVKHGSHHKLHVSAEHHKKITKAHMKGAGTTIQLDPYAIDLNRQHLGCGINSAVKNLGRAVKHGVRHVGRQIHHGVKHVGRQISNRLESELENLGSHISSASSDLGSHIGSQFENVGSHIAPVGSGFKRRRQRGRGFVGSLAKHAGKAVAKEAVHQGSRALEQRLMGGALAPAGYGEGLRGGRRGRRGRGEGEGEGVLGAIAGRYLFPY